MGVQSYRTGKALHIEISTDKQRLAQSPQSAASHINDVEVLADFGETVGPIISRGVKSDLVALRGQCASKRNTLPLATTFDQQFMHD